MGQLVTFRKGLKITSSMYRSQEVRKSTWIRLISLFSVTSYGIGPAIVHGARKSNNMLRHLVELFVTKRIDFVKLSLQLRTFKDRIGNFEMASPDGFPLLSEAGRLYFRRSQCELLSVYASMGTHPAHP